MARSVWRGGAVVLGGAMLLAACGEREGGEPDAGDARTASGEVLEGTISDEMIPLDELRSQAPPIRIVPKVSGEEAEGEEGEEEAIQADDGTQAPAEPAAPDAPAE